MRREEYYLTEERRFDGVEASYRQMVMDTYSHTEPKTHHRLSHTAHRTRESRGDCGSLRERLRLITEN